HSQQDKSQGGHAAQMGSQQHSFLIILGILETAKAPPFCFYQALRVRPNFVFAHKKWAARQAAHLSVQVANQLPAPPSTVTARRFCDQQEMSSQTATGRSLP